MENGLWCSLIYRTNGSSFTTQATTLVTMQVLEAMQQLSRQALGPLWLDHSWLLVRAASRD